MQGIQGITAYIRKHWIALTLTVLAVAGALLPSATFAAPYTMGAVSIPGDDILATAVNVFGALTPVLIVVAGLAMGMWLLSRVASFFTGKK